MYTTLKIISRKFLGVSLIWNFFSHVGAIFYETALNGSGELQSCQTKEYKIGICCFSAKNSALRRKNNDWLARNQNNVSEANTEKEL
jgi:hypothetical protein